MNFGIVKNCFWDQQRIVEFRPGPAGSRKSFLRKGLQNGVCHGVKLMTNAYLWSGILPGVDWKVWFLMLLYFYSLYLQAVVIDEVDNFLFRPHLGLKAKYYAVWRMHSISLSMSFPHSKHNYSYFLSVLFIVCLYAYIQN